VGGRFWWGVGGCGVEEQMRFLFSFEFRVCQFRVKATATARAVCLPALSFEFAGFELDQQQKQRQPQEQVRLRVSPLRPQVRLLHPIGQRTPAGDPGPSVEMTGWWGLVWGFDV
jgi:hypothetical protein